MTQFYQGLVDARGRPIEKAALTQEIAAPTIAGVRSPLTGYPGDGLNPQRLASILKEADTGNPVRQLELAETVEERDPHILGILGTRRRSVSQLEITVEDGSDDAAHKQQAEAVRDWLKRDELTSELFDMLDAIHKGYSFTEIVWDTSMGQWRPDRLEWRDPRWFDFERHDLRTPRLIAESGERLPLPGGKFIFAPMAAKSGIPTRSGLSRVLAWVWMFKAFSNRDWAIFTQTFGQPIRIGKYGQGASEADRSALYRAVANVAGDMAAIIPDSMALEFVEAKSVASSTDLYERRVTHLDLQASKAVLGQTTTTDAVSGGHAVSQEHREVQEDIETADAKQLAAHINRDLIRPWVDLEYGPQAAYPRVRIGRPDETDVELVVNSVKTLGLPVKRSEIYAMIGVSEPEGDDIFVPASSAPPIGAGQRSGDGSIARPGQPLGDPSRLPDPTAGGGRTPAELLNAEQQTLGEQEAARRDRLISRLGGELDATDATGVLLDLIGGLVADPSIRDLEDLRTRLLSIAPTLSEKSLALALRQALVVADLSGRSDLVGGQR